LALLVLALQNPKQLALRLGNPAQGRDLTAQRSFLNRCQRYVRSERDVNGFALECRGLGLGVCRLDSASRASPYVGDKRDADVWSVKAVDARAICGIRLQRLRRDLLAACVERGVD
jgi:hypothetical protein